MEQAWNDLLFAHWPVTAEMLRALVPATLALDTWSGQTWVAVTPFYLGLGPRWLQSLPGLFRFPELNVRTYVIFDGKPGVYFFSLDAGSRLAVWSARLTYRLPYFSARMWVKDDRGWIRYHSFRNPAAEFKGRYRPIGPVELRAKGSLEHWLSERYCLYTTHGGSLYRAEIHHPPWPLQNAEAEIETNTMAQAATITLPPLPPLLHFAKKLEVLVWPLEKVSDGPSERALSLSRRD